MWVQVIKSRLKPGLEAGLHEVTEALQAAEQPDSGFIRATVGRDQKDPSTIYMMVAFESEEKARARESDPRRQELLAPVQQKMAEIFEGPPEFIDLDVMTEYAS